MAEFSMPFDAVEVEPNVYDREYNALEFAEYLGGLVETGVMRGRLDEFALRNTGDNMQTFMASGIAYIGIGEAIHYYKNDSELTLTHDTESIGLNRIDRIVLRLDLNTSQRQIKAQIKKGVAAANPVAPSLQRDDMVYELSIGQVYIVGGQTYIGSDAITYEVGNRTLCPYATSNILPYIDESLELVKFKQDYGYQEATVSGDTIVLNRVSDTPRLQFKLHQVVTGNPIKISLDANASSIRLLNFDGTNVMRLDPGFIEIYNEGSNFYLVPKGGGAAVIEDYNGFVYLQEFGGSVQDFAVDDRYAYVLQSSLLQKVEIKNFAVVGQYGINADSNNRIALIGDYLYVANLGANKLVKLNKNNLTLVAEASGATVASRGLIVSNGRLFGISAHTNKIHEINIYSLTLVSSGPNLYSTNLNVRSVSIADGYAYCQSDNFKLSKVNVNTMSVVSQAAESIGISPKIAFDGTNVYVTVYNQIIKFNKDLTAITTYTINDHFESDVDVHCLLYLDNKLFRQRYNSSNNTSLLRINADTGASEFLGVLETNGYIERAFSYKNIILLLKNYKIVKMYNQNS